VSRQVYKIQIDAGTQLHHRLPNFFKKAKVKDLDVIVFYDTEGGIFANHTDAFFHEKMDMFSVLHYVCEKVEYPIERVSLWWANVNVVEQYDTWCRINKPKERLKDVRYNPWWMYTLVGNAGEEPYEETPLAYKGRLFTFFNGHSRQHRIDALNFLKENSILKHTEWTFANNKDLHKIDKSLHDKLPKTAEPDILPAQGPMSLSNHVTLKPGEQFKDMYRNTLFDLITETLYHHDVFYYPEYKWWKTIFLTEKVFRSILYKRPFILIGNQGSLRALSQLGFVTFPELFDENYDHLDDDERIMHVLKQVKDIDYTKFKEILMSEKIQNRLEKNRQTLLDIVDSYKKDGYDQLAVSSPQAIINVKGRTSW